MGDISTLISHLIDEWTLIKASPISATTLVVIVGGIVWWLAKIFFKSEVNGLRAQIAAQQESARVLEQRLNLAKEQEQVAATVRRQVESTAKDLQRSVDAGSSEEVKASAKSLVSHISEMSSTQTALEETLSNWKSAANGRQFTQEGVNEIVRMFREGRSDKEVAELI